MQTVSPVRLHNQSTLNYKTKHTYTDIKRIFEKLALSILPLFKEEKACKARSRWYRPPYPLISRYHIGKKKERKKRKKEEKKTPPNPLKTTTQQQQGIVNIYYIAGCT